METQNNYQQLITEQQKIFDEWCALTTKLAHAQVAPFYQLVLTLIKIYDKFSNDIEV